MRLIAISSGNPPNKVYLIWEIPFNGNIAYTVHRDGKVIADNLPDNESKVDFEHPTLFDHDHGTNLFTKDSTHKLMYVDENVNRYRHYEYKVTAKRLDEGMEIIESNEVTIQAL